MAGGIGCASAENAASESGGNSTANAASTSSNPATPTQAQASQAAQSNNSADQSAGGAITTSGTSGAQANGSADAGGASISLTLNVQSTTNASSAAATKSAGAEASANGAIGPAKTQLSITATASSSADQQTASATGSDGSSAKAMVGIITSIAANVPGGISKQITNGSGMSQISCNASGTCARASIFGNSVTAGIRLVSTTGLLTTGGAEAVLSAVLAAEVSAGPSELMAVASADITGTGRSVTVQGNETNIARISGIVESRSSSRIGQAEASALGGDRGGILTTARVWQSGNTICASTKAAVSGGGSTKFRTVTRCRGLSKAKAKIHKISHSGLLQLLFD